MLMSAADYRDSLRAYKPRVFVNGSQVPSVADEPLLAPGIAAVGVAYDFALRKEHLPIMTARQGTSGKTVNRMLHIDETSQDLLYKLEAVRLVCRTAGCAQRYLTHDAFNGVYQSTRLTDDRHGYGPPPVHYVGKTGTFVLLAAFPVILLAQAVGSASSWLTPIGWGLAWWALGLYWAAAALYLTQTSRLLRAEARAG